MNWPIFAKEKILDPNIDLESTCLKIKQSGLSIASLNGSFDLVHAGHLHMLYEASKQGDKLIVALNSDSSIKKYKSHQRPLIPLEQRIILITGFSFVDYVTWFEEETPLKKRTANFMKKVALSKNEPKIVEIDEQEEEEVKEDEVEEEEVKEEEVEEEEVEEDEVEEEEEEKLEDDVKLQDMIQEELNNLN